MGELSELCSVRLDGLFVIEIEMADNYVIFDGVVIAYFTLHRDMRNLFGTST